LPADIEFGAVKAMPRRGIAGAPAAGTALDLGPFSTGLKARFGARAIRASRAPGIGAGITEGQRWTGEGFRR